MNVTALTRRSRLIASRIAGHLLVVGGALLMLAPLYFLVVFATHTTGDILDSPPPVTFGDALSMNWDILQRRLPVLASIGSSAYVAILRTALALLLCSLAGFAFAMYEFRLKRTLFAIVLATMFVHPVVYAAPKVVIMHALGWLDRPIALWLPGAASALGVFFMRRYIAFAIPKELVEAARCDGCSEWRIYRSVVLPLLRPGLVTLGVLTFVTSWNDFLGPFLVLRSVDRYTLPLASLGLISPNNTAWGVMMLVAAISVVPPLLLLALSLRSVMAALTTAAGRRELSPALNARR